MQLNQITSDQLAYMGDDILDIDSMQYAALKACPRDASNEVKKISNYFSSKNGGDTCVRELIELVMKVQSRW